MDTKHFAECIFYVQNGLKSYIFHSVLRELRTPGGTPLLGSLLLKKKELCIFSDASVKAIAAVVYLQIINSDGDCRVGFVPGKVKVVPPVAQTILWFELGTAVLTKEVVELVENESVITVDSLLFYRHQGCFGIHT